MNEKNAREILEIKAYRRAKGLEVDESLVQAGYGATCYLEAIEKVRGLVESIKFTLTPHNRLICDCHERPEQKLLQALAKWEKEK